MLFTSKHVRDVKLPPVFEYVRQGREGCWEREGGRRRDEKRRVVPRFHAAEST